MKNTGTQDFQSEHEEQRTHGGSRPGNHSTEHARKTGTEVIPGEAIEHRLGRGGGSRSPFSSKRKIGVK